MNMEVREKRLALLKREGDTVGEHRWGRLSVARKTARLMAVDLTHSVSVGVPVIERAKFLGDCYEHRQSITRRVQACPATLTTLPGRPTANPRHSEGGK